MPATPARSSPNAPPTSAPAACSDETAANWPNGGSPSTSRLPELDFSTLTPRGQAIRILIGDRLPQGYKLNAIATELGQSVSWVSQRLQELRDELTLAAGRFFPLTPTEYDALRQSIADDGVLNPILIGEHIACLDGYHRCTISLELGLTEIPAVFVSGKSAEEEYELSLALNTARRQLNRAQKQSLVRAELHRDPGRSDRRIAAVCGVAPTTVGSLRAAMAEEERVHNLHDNGARGRFEPEVRVDSIGRVRPQPEVAHGDTVDSDKPLGHADCCHGQRHAILRDGGGYRLEAR